MKEFNNREVAKKHAEYITGQATRKYLANKVRQYLKGDITVFDGAVGSGQLEQYLEAKHICGVDVQSQSIEMFKENYEDCEAHNQSFFTFDTEKQYDVVVMNPPFSLKFKELPEEDRQKIQEEFNWKKSGVVDDIFVLKSLKYTKRYAFYILFPGVGYRASEKKFRELIGNQLAECNVIENGFDDTGISVLFLVIDKEKTSNLVKREQYDAKADKILISDEIEIDIPNESKWQQIRYIEPREEITTQDLVLLEINARVDMVLNLERSIKTSALILEIDKDIGYPPLITYFVQIEELLKRLKEELL